MPKHLAIAVDLELTQPVSGSVQSEGVDPIRFHGWLQLHSALEAICFATEPERTQSKGSQCRPANDDIS